MIIRARIVVTMDGPPIENGAIAISGNRIVDVGDFDAIKARTTDEVVDLGEQVLLPGLINAHCHLDYTWLRGRISQQQSFTDWIRAINAEKEKLSAEDYVASLNAGFAEARQFGTTTIANLTAVPELIREIDPSIRTWWFAEVIDVRAPERASEIIDRKIKALRSTENWGLAPHAPFTASASAYRRCAEEAKRETVSLTTHLAESREEMSMFRDASGPLYEYMKEIGRDMGDCGHGTPLAHFLEAIEVNRPYLSARNGNDWIVAHLNELAESDFDLLASSAAKFDIVHCPCSHKYFRHSPFQFEKLRGLGFNICLGTDSLASNDDLSLFAEMRQFQESEPRISPEEILSMVTLNAARALRKPHLFGCLRGGLFADVIAVPMSASQKEIFEAIVGFKGEVNFSMVDGEVIHTNSQAAGGRFSQF